MKRGLYVIIYFAVFWIIIPGALFLISIILDRFIFHDARLNTGCVIAGNILGISGFLFLLLTICQFRLFSGEYPVSATPPDKIINRGIFAVWRHPVYLFASLTLCGIAISIRSPALLIIVFPIFMILVSLYTFREEAILIKRFGNEYINYKRNVPLLIPRLYHWLKIPGFFFFKFWFRLKVLNRENIPPSLPFIVVSGHRHYFDPLFISYAIPVPLRHVSTYEMFRNPLIRNVFTRFGVIPRRRYMKDTAGTMRILTAIRSGFPVCIFPEGGRSWTGRLRPFKPESIRLLKHLKDIPVLPVRIEGNYHSWPRWGNHLMRSDITVIIEKPVFIDPEIPDQALESYLRSIVEPVNEFPENIKCHAKSRIENLSRVIYRCPVCLTMDSPAENPPDVLHCKFCNTIFYLAPDFKIEFNVDGVIKADSIYNLYDCIKIKITDIYNLSPGVSDEEYKAYLKTGEILIYASHCQLWTEVGSAFKKSLNGLCLLTERSVKISNDREEYIIPLEEIGAVTIESNYKLQIYNDRNRTLKQITFKTDSALKWQDILSVFLTEGFNKQIITR